MPNDLYFYIILLGVILIGFSLLSQRGNKGSHPEVNHQTVQLLAGMKQDMDQKINELSRQIQEVQKEIEHVRIPSTGSEPPLGEEIQQKLNLNQRYAEVFELWNKGMSHAEIALQLEMGIGEVEMILQLQKMTNHGGSHYE